MNSVKDNRRVMAHARATIFVFAAFCLVITPAYLAAEEPWLKTVGGEFPSRHPGTPWTVVSVAQIALGEDGGHTSVQFNSRTTEPSSERLATFRDAGNFSLLK